MQSLASHTTSGRSARPSLAGKSGGASIPASGFVPEVLGSSAASFCIVNASGGMPWNVTARWQKLFLSKLKEVYCYRIGAQF